MFQIEVKKHREALGLSQKALSDKIGVSQGTVGFWESGGREPSIEKLVLLAKFFNTTTDSLLGLSKPEIKEHNRYEKLSTQEKHIIDIFRSLSPQGADYFMNQANIASQLYTKKALYYSENL